jgi:hypothetical protein
MWRDILVANREEVLKQSQRFRHTLDALEHVMREGNADALEDLIRGPAEGRAAWQMGAVRRPRRPGPDLALGGGRRPARCPSNDVPPSSTCRRCGRGRHGALPGSKSISNRVLLLAGLAPGTTDVHDLLDSDDTRVMLAALRMRWAAALERRTAPCCACTGLGGRLKVHEPALPGQCRHRHAPADRRAGRAGRHAGRPLHAAGVPRMHERPIGDLVDALRPLGCRSTTWASRVPAAAPARQAGGRLATSARSACAATCPASS